METVKTYQPGHWLPVGKATLSRDLMFVNIRVHGIIYSVRVEEMLDLISGWIPDVVVSMLTLEK